MQYTVSLYVQILSVLQVSLALLGETSSNYKTGILTFIAAQLFHHYCSLTGFMRTKLLPELNLYISRIATQHQ